MLHRRGFLAAASGFASRRLVSGSPFPLQEIERARVLKAANRYLNEAPFTITASHSARSAGGAHDYFSEGDYWWPDPKNPDGPYIRRDGMSNPDNFLAHREALLRLSVQVPALCAAWMVTGDQKYAKHAASHLRAWFIGKTTKMNPNLQYAQAIHGITTGRGTGIIDTLQLVDVVQGARRIDNSGALNGDERRQLRQWFSDYLDWMTQSKNGKEERDATNNHGTCWVLQAAAFASYTGNGDVEKYCRERITSVLIPKQIGPDGSFPQELVRTKPYSYSLFNLEVMAGICQILSTTEDDLWAFKLPDGRGVERALAYMYPYIEDKRRWPHAKDVEYFDQWPVREQSLLFGGLALNRPEYLRLWQRLNPDPTVEEVIRNYPIRQPVLWMNPAIDRNKVLRS